MQKQEKIEYTRKHGSEGAYSKLRLTKDRIVEICKGGRLSDFIHRQQQIWTDHCVRARDTNFIKQLQAFVDYFKDKGEKKKTGITDSTCRQVQCRRAAEKGLTEMIKK